MHFKDLILLFIKDRLNLLATECCQMAFKDEPIEFDQGEGKELNTLYRMVVKISKGEIQSAHLTKKQAGMILELMHELDVDKDGDKIPTPLIDMLDEWNELEDGSD